MKWLDNKLNNFYCKKNYVDFLQYVHQQQETCKDTDDKPTMLVAHSTLKDRYSKDEINATKFDLINGGFLIQPKKHNSNIFITESGKIFLQDYYQFKMQGLFSKFTTVFRKNFIAAVSFVSLVLSIINLFFSK